MPPLGLMTCPTRSGSDTYHPTRLFCPPVQNLKKFRTAKCWPLTEAHLWSTAARQHSRRASRRKLNCVLLCPSAALPVSPSLIEVHQPVQAKSPPHQSAMDEALAIA